MTSPAAREPAHGAFLYGLIVICALVAADLLGVPGRSSFGQIFLLLGLPLWANALLARRSTLFDPNGRAAVATVLTCTTALGLLALFSATYADQPIRVARVLLTMLTSLAMFAFVAGTLTERRLFPLVATLAGALAMVSILTIVAQFVPPLSDFVFKGSDRSSGTFKNPNQYGIVISTVAPVTAGLFLATRGKQRLIIFGFLVLLLAGLLFSGSKANLMLTGSSLAAFALIMSATSFRGVERTLVILLAIVGIMLAFILGIYLLQILNPRAYLLITVFFDPNQTLPSLNSRQELWDESIRIFMARPWLGEGAGQFLNVALDGELVSHSHNLFIDFARTLGAPGLVFISVLVVTVLTMVATTILGLLGRDLGRFRIRALLVGAALSSSNYVFANFSSESFGPSTSPFFWLTLFLFFMLRGELLRESAIRMPPPKPLVLLFSDRSQKA